MTPKNFYNKLTSKLQEQLGPEWTTELCTDILANNGKKKIVIAIGRRGTTVYPRISLEAYFEEYMHGKEMGTIIEDILNTVQKAFADIPKDAFRWVENWKAVKDSIFFRLVSKKRNEEYLNTMVYEEFCDLMAIAVVQVFSDDKSIKTMRVTKTLLSHWNVSESEVLNEARQNTERLCPGKIMDMLGVISGMLEPSEKELFPDAEKIPQDMYVLTNANKINGATVMMYDSFLQRLHQKIGTFILLPSSIHEVIVYPFDKNSMSFYEYQQMVMEINQTCVLEEEVLADSVYLYDGNQVLLVADENGVYYNEDDFNN